jgi:hypothetical protein
MPSSCSSKVQIFATEDQTKLVENALFDAQAAKAYRKNVVINRKTLFEMNNRKLMAAQQRLATLSEASEIRALEEEIESLEATAENIESLDEKLVTATEMNSLTENEISEMVVHEYTVASGDVNNVLRKVRSYESFANVKSQNFDKYSKLVNTGINDAAER